jgi:hypothetical protein
MAARGSTETNLKISVCRAARGKPHHPSHTSRRTFARYNAMSARLSTSSHARRVPTYRALHGARVLHSSIATDGS